MNFCAAILILKMEEYMQLFFAIFFVISRKVKMQLKQKICAVFGGDAVTNQTCQKRFVKFLAGGFSLNDAPWSGRPAEVDRDQIETLIENNQRYTMWEIADVLKVSKSIKLSVKIQTHVFYRKNLTDFLAKPVY